MEQEITAVVQQHDEVYIGFCDHYPEANGQGRTLPDCLRNLADALDLVMEERQKATPSSHSLNSRKEEPFSVTPIAMGLPEFECTSELLEHLDALERGAGNRSS